MKLSTALGVIVLAATASTASLALSGSKSFSKTLAPGVSFKAPTADLYVDVKYTLFCDIKNTKPQVTEKSALQISTDKNLDFTINGVTISPTSRAIVETKDKGTTVVLRYINKLTTVEFRSIDFSNDITVSCHADAVTG
ncbi:MAG: hypothetical protein A3F43_04100 [Gammaproteobacteria bacterium RIFCSPHIGHO2_12_FULL_42_10]|nr:MAG: hypothetical protein A3F43_04100 [Gammaproteobacteria bacterium RIFCSPHIGHO2_12_FULL_42_10]